MLPNLYFWRDQTGHEVDLIGEWSGTIHAIEIKSNSTFQKDFLSNLNFFAKLAPHAQRYLISNSVQEGKFLETTLVPINKIKILE